ncbi:unnamed protein product [Soboliphyme baturini]|uniref:Intraflagellar transport protein 122 homolog n=1 Tax=Soboliphyme baturini TaxID=241478 RepID=A0A183IF01_9BILA|nr:unnamed protein product [Soboliphyme baturini]
MKFTAVIFQGLSDEAKAHNNGCLAGVARMSIRLGDIRRGFQIAKECNSLSLMRECASLLEETKNYNDAALLYENGKFFDKAAAVFAKINKWEKVEELLPSVHCFSIYKQYGQAMEVQRKYEKSVDAYKCAKDYEDAARYFLKKGDYASAVQFLVLADDFQEAFKLAVKHDQVATYAEALGTSGTAEEYQHIAEYFIQRQNYCMVGKYLMMCNKYDEALDYLMKNGDSNESLELAVDCVGRAKDDAMQKKLILFLLGEVDGLPKVNRDIHESIKCSTAIRIQDPQHIFRLYTVLNMPTEAAKTAMIIAQQEQMKGNYRKARDLLFEMYSELMKKNIKIPQELQNNLMLIHSYLLIKSLTKRGENMLAARMLIRVVKNISLFPTHAVKILTSAVIQCSKVGLRKSAFNFCVILMRPEYRNDIDEKYKRKIEHIIRKWNQIDKEKEEDKSSCPFCGQSIPSTSLICDHCKSSIPYCIATGSHTLKDDLCFCPSCKFAAIFTEFTKLIEYEERCPMCSEVISIDRVTKVEGDVPIAQCHFSCNRK